MKMLNKQLLDQADLDRYESVQSSPITILQIGEGNFLRGFMDWMIHVCRSQGLYEGSIAVTQPRPSGKHKIEALARQDGLYTLVTRGIEQGERVERREIVTVVAKAFDPYSDWNAFLTLAASPDLQIVVSNTTEAGLTYRPEVWVEHKPIESYPGKVTALLYRRFLAFDGATDRGLIFLPCELLERNGDELQACVLRYIGDWRLPDAFKTWVLEHNRFLNSLVDRIVTGHPGEEQAEAWFTEWGYTDAMLNTAEPYHFWAIEGEEELERLLPLRKAGLNVIWTDDLKPYQLRKVRILNGAHTLMTPLGLLYGLEQVREVMEHQEFGPFVREAVAEDIIPSVPLPERELRQFAESVFERFHNPFIKHRLADIAMNSISKFKVRLLPVLLHAAERGQPMPDRLVRAFAGLLRYYQVQRDEDGGYWGETLDRTRYTVRDDAAVLEMLTRIWTDAREQNEPLEQTVSELLKRSELWGRDLTELPGLQAAVCSNWTQWRGDNTR